MTTTRDRSYYDVEYNQKERSIYDIADEHGTYPNKIRREIKACGYTLRDKSAAQTAAIRHGRHKHPTKGNKRPEAVRNRISEAMAETWQAMDEEERLRRAQVGRQQWEAMTGEQKENFKTLAAKAVRRASKDGSKLERFLQAELTVRGYRVAFHAEALVQHEEKLQVDLFLPHLGVCIEVDGPSHFLPIWGEANLQRKQENDNQKTNLLISKGMVMIRIKHLIKTVSEIQKRNLLNEVVAAIEHAKDHPPAGIGWLTEIEVK